jgi:hypothetical protein
MKYVWWTIYFLSVAGVAAFWVREVVPMAEKDLRERDNPEYDPEITVGALLVALLFMFTPLLNTALCIAFYQLGERIGNFWSWLIDFPIIPRRRK